FFYFFLQAKDDIRNFHVTGVQTCALPIYDLEPVVEDVIMLGEYDDRVYIEPTKVIMDLPNDRGILRITTEEGQKLDRVPLERLEIGRASCREKEKVDVKR